MTARPVPPEPAGASGCAVVDTLDAYLDEALVDDFVANCMRAVTPFYDDAVIRMATVRVRDARPLIRALDQHRLARATRLLEEMRNRGARPYAPLLLAKKAAGEAWLLFPPVIEVRGGRVYVINGHHRLLAARQLEVKKVRAVKVECADAPMPARALDWRELDVTAEPPGNRFYTAERLDPALIRPAASFFKSQYFFFPSIDRAVDWCRWFAESPHRWRWNSIECTLGRA